MAVTLPLDGNLLLSGIFSLMLLSGNSEVLRDFSFTVSEFTSQFTILYITIAVSRDHSMHHEEYISRNKFHQGSKASLESSRIHDYKLVAMTNG